MTQSLFTTTPSLNRLHDKSGRIKILHSAQKKAAKTKNQHTAVQCLENAGFAVTIFPEILGPELLAQTTDLPETDIGLVDLRGYHLSAHQAHHIANAIPNAHQNILFLVDDSLPSSTLVWLAKAGRICLEQDCLGDLPNICRNMLRSEATRQETRHRIESLAHLQKVGRFPDLSPSTSTKTVLIAGEPGRDTLSLSNQLTAAGYTVFSTYRPTQTMRALETEKIDSAIFFPNSTSDPLLALARAMRRHVQHQKIPVILASHDDDDGNDAMHAIRYTREQLRTYGHVLIDGVTHHAAHMQTMRRYLRSCGIPSVRNQTSRMFHGKFFAHHASRLCHHADKSDRKLYFIGIHIKNPAAKSLTRQTIHAQTGPLIDRIIRTEDMLAELGTKGTDAGCVVTLSSPNEHTARQVAERIAGVIRNSMFRNDKKQPIQLDIKTSLYARPKGLRLEETTAAILRQLR